PHVRLLLAHGVGCRAPTSEHPGRCHETTLPSAPAHPRLARASGSDWHGHIDGPNRPAGNGWRGALTAWNCRNGRTTGGTSWSARTPRRGRPKYSCHSQAPASPQAQPGNTAGKAGADGSASISGDAGEDGEPEADFQAHSRSARGTLAATASTTARRWRRREESAFPG